MPESQQKNRAARKNPTESAIRQQTGYAGNTKAQVDELM
jgi:hypothetical protein